MYKLHVSPLRYPGGKTKISKYLSKLHTQNGAPEIWFEPFGGGLGAGLKLLEQDLIGELWFCEANPSLATFWTYILCNATDFEKYLQVQYSSMSLIKFREAQSILANPLPGNDLEIAAATLVVNRCSRSGIIDPKASPIGGAKQDGQYTVSARWNIKRTIDQIKHIKKYSHSIRFIGHDGVKSVQELADSGINDDELFIFVDPPYVKEGNRLYKYGMTRNQHEKLADTLLASPYPWALTYDASELVNSLYTDQVAFQYSLQYTANRSKEGLEQIIFSDNCIPLYQPPRELKW
ncbi:DNA adenine methylase [Rothia sp. P5764]|uniref:DNA adenine methylase n=1 Tax=Rothia sp. P5764 TaxID=3402654 RepID=UPI003AC492FF